jgi:predicted DNA-binding protein
LQTHAPAHRLQLFRSGRCFDALHAWQFSRSLKGMTVTLDMPKEIEAQFTAAAQTRGVPLSDYLRDFVVEHFQDDADDLRTAQERIADPQLGITSNQLRKSLGLDG